MEEDKELYCDECKKVVKTNMSAGSMPVYCGNGKMYWERSVALHCAECDNILQYDVIK
jgi:hypothetical protein